MTSSGHYGVQRHVLIETISSCNILLISFIIIEWGYGAVVARSLCIITGTICERSWVRPPIAPFFFAQTLFFLLRGFRSQK